MTSALALLLVWAALLVPDRVDDLAPSAFLRIPVEGLVFVVLVLVLPPRVARILALVGGLGLGVLTILRLLDMGFHFAFDRPFHPVYDTAYAGSAVGLLGDSVGRVGAVVVQIGAGLLIVALLALLPLSAVRLTRRRGNTPAAVDPVARPSDRDRDGHHVVRRPAGAGRTNRLHRVGPARLHPRHAGP